MGMSVCMFICWPIDSLLFLPGLNSTPRAVSWKIYNFLVQITWPCTQVSRNCIMILTESWKHLYLFITEISNSINSARYCDPSHRLPALQPGPAVKLRVWTSLDGAIILSTKVNKNITIETSLVVQWLRVHLAIQGMWVRSLVEELRAHMLQSN